MVSDGIERLRGERSHGAVVVPGHTVVRSIHSMPTISNDATSASELSQRYNVIVFPIYSIGLGRAARSGGTGRSAFRE